MVNDIYVNFNGLTLLILPLLKLIVQLNSSIQFARQFSAKVSNDHKNYTDYKCNL